MGNVCCGKAAPNKHGHDQQVKTKPTAAPAMGEAAMSDSERQEVMNAYANVYLEKGQDIFKREGADQVMKYLMNPAELLARLRNDTRFKAKPALVEAFEAFDTKPRDAVLSVDESNEFISAYFKAMERFVEQLYTDGLKILQEGKVSNADTAQAKRVSSMFSKKNQELKLAWHKSCDKNGDGKLQLSEVTVAFMGDQAGHAETLLGNFLSEEFDGILFKQDEQV